MPLQLQGSLAQLGSLYGSLSNIGSMSGSLAFNPDNHRQYEGAYTFTPTNSVQTIEIADLVATADITIEPIPDNYGLITWDGSTLTVS